jgi:hypothetical protein
MRPQPAVAPAAQVQPLQAQAAEQEGEQGGDCLVFVTGLVQNSHGCSAK